MNNTYPTSNRELQQTTPTTYTGYGPVLTTAYPLPNVYPVGTFPPANPPFVSGSTTVLPPPPSTFQGVNGFYSALPPNSNSELLQNLPKSSNEPSNIIASKDIAPSAKKEKGTSSKDKCCNMNDESDHHHRHHHHHHHPDNYRYSESGCKPKKQVEHYWFC